MAEAVKCTDPTCTGSDADHTCDYSTCPDCQQYCQSPEVRVSYPLGEQADVQNPHHVCAVCGGPLSAEAMTMYYWHFNGLPWWATCGPDHETMLKGQTND